MKIVSLIFSTVLAFSCIIAGQNEKYLQNGKNGDVFYQWTLQNGTMGFSVQIEIESTYISLEYRRFLLRKDSLSHRYKLTDTQIKSLLDSVIKYKYVELKQPTSTKTVGAPNESMTYVNKGKLTTLEMGRVEKLPLSYIKVREKIFELMNEFEKDWKKRIDLE